MSRMTIASYRDLEAERRRAEQRETQRLRKGLRQCLGLERELAALEETQAGECVHMLARLDKSQAAAGQRVSAAERRQWLDWLPIETERLKHAIASAHERRI